jgi:TonB family protein
VKLPAQALCVLVLWLGAAPRIAIAQNNSSPAPTPVPTTPGAQLALGNDYLAKKDYASAMTWFRKAAEKGNGAAENNVGWLYEKGWGVNQDYAEAFKWFVKGANHNDPYAQNNLGRLYFEGNGAKQDYAEAMKWYRKAAEQPNTSAQVNVGWLYENGFGVKQDYSEAMTWYLQAADKGNAQAQNNLGVLYEKGLGVTQDYASAMAWYYRSAGQGYERAQTNLGDLYQNGYGIKQDYAKAMTWYLKAADQGDARAQNAIGWLYQQGLGVDKDYSLAKTWYQKAADQGNEKAKANLAWISQITSENNSGGSGNKAANAEAGGASPPNSNKVTPPTIVLPGGINAPRVTYQPDPEYSEQARKSKYSGEVLLSLIVGPDGVPRNIKSLAPLGEGLDEKAIDAVKTWKFEPATKEGKPVAVQIMVEVSFRLYGSGGVGKVEAGGKAEASGKPSGDNSSSYLAPAIAQAGKCWTKWAEDKTHSSLSKPAQVTVAFAINGKNQIAKIAIASSNGNDALNGAAQECVSSLKMSKPFPVELKGNDLPVRMQFLYNDGGVSVTPGAPQIVLGARVQFNLGIAGTERQPAKWSLTGAGCTEAACGTISADGLYTAPGVLPDPPYVRVKGTLAGANPIAASTIIFLAKDH